MSSPDDPTEPVPQQSGYQAPGYGPPAYPVGPGQPGTRATSSRASTVLVLGIVSLVTFFAMCGLGFVPAVIALAMAPAARRETAASGGAMEGASQVRTGSILAWITLGLTALAVVAAIAFIALAATGFESSTGGGSPAPAVSQVTPG